MHDYSRWVIIAEDGKPTKLAKKGTAMTQTIAEITP